MSVVCGAETVASLEDQHRSDQQVMTNLENRTNFAESHLEKLRAKFVKLLGERGVAAGVGKAEEGIATTHSPVTASVSRTIDDGKISAPMVQQQSKVYLLPISVYQIALSVVA